MQEEKTMDFEQKEYTCCFFGHRKINETEELKNNLYEIIENLITKEKIDTFLFGSKSDFDSLCLKTVTTLKEKYPHIKRIYVRAEFQYIDEAYRNYLLKSYDDTYYPKHIENSGKAAYIARNREMIDKSDVCVVYFDENYAPPKRKRSKADALDYIPKSGTSLAVDYATKRKRKIINILI